MTRDEYRCEVLKVKDRLHSYCVWMLGDREEAKDVTQDAFLRLWQCRGDVTVECCRAWLLRTASRLCLDQLRRRSRRGQHELANHTVEAPDEWSSPSTSFRGAELRPALGEALGELSSNERAVIILREMEGMSYEQIATVLERSLSSVKVSLHRARRRLRKQCSAAMRVA